MSIYKIFILNIDITRSNCYNSSLVNLWNSYNLDAPGLTKIENNKFMEKSLNVGN
jgi:hypothetical protein